MAGAVEYHAGKLGSFTRLVLGMVKKDPSLVDDYERLRANVYAVMPELRDKGNCFNCSASMIEYIFKFDSWDALLLLRMADAVKHRRFNDMPFTEANQVRIPELPVSHAVKCRTTQASKLGLVAQLRNRGGKRVPGVWVITKRGWEALAGRPVPAKVKVWRGKIEEKFDDRITIDEALKSHVEYVTRALGKGRKVREDHRDYIADFKFDEWCEWAVHEGAIELV